MKGNITSGAGLGGTHKYIVGKPGSTYICGSCPPGDWLRTVAALRKTRPDCKKAAIHISLSAAPGEYLQDADWEAATNIMREEMGLEKAEFQTYRHADNDHDHIHFEACKILPDGTLWNDSHSARRLHKACERIEKELGLRITKTVEDQKKERLQGAAAKPISNGSLREFQRTGKPNQRTKDAIARRIRDERERANQKTHREADRNPGRLDECKTGNQKQNPETRQENQGIRYGNQRPQNHDFATRTPKPAAEKTIQTVLKTKEQEMYKNSLTKSIKNQRFRS